MIFKLELIKPSLIMLVALLLSYQSSIAQQPTSKDKTQITYKVKPGDTKYSLAKRFGISILELENQNPHIKGGLQAGHILEVENAVADNRYIVKKGDTKFSLAKRFGLTIEALEEANPQIVPVLKSGELLIIPDTSKIATQNSEENTSTIATSDLDNASTQVSKASTTVKFVDYTIKPKETLYGLSKRAQMSIPDFLKINPALAESVIEGTIIKMPDFAVDANTADKVMRSTNEAASYVNLSKTIDVTKSPNILITLPFSINDYEKMKKLRDEEPLQKYLDFYNGAKIAIDSAIALGLTVSVDVLKITTETTSTIKEAEKIAAKFTSYDAIIAPNYQSELKLITSNTNISNTPIILENDNINTVRHNYVYVAKPSVEMQKLKLFDYIHSQNANTIVIIDSKRSDHKSFIKSNVPQAKFIETSTNKPFDGKSLVSALKSYATNTIILETDDKNVYLNVTNLLLPKMTEYNIQLMVLDASLIPSKADVSDMRYKLLKLTYPASKPLTDPYATTVFNKKYHELYGYKASIQAKYGFDITFDTLLRIAQPIDFNASAKRHETFYLTGRIDYKKDRLGGYSNNGIYIIQYHPEKGMIEIDL